MMPIFLRRLAWSLAATMLLSSSCVIHDDLDFTTGDRVLDFALSKIDSKLSCVKLTGETIIVRDGTDLMPLYASISDIQNKEARRAATFVAITGPKTVDKSPTQTLGSRPVLDCPMIVSTPLRSGSFTFIAFSSQNVGLLVIKHEGESLHLIETVQLGVI